MKINQVQRRSCPGRIAAEMFLEYLRFWEDIPEKRNAYISLLRGLQKLEATIPNAAENPCIRRRKAWDEFEHELYDHALGVESWRLDWESKRGLVVSSGTLRIHALLGLLELFKRGRLHRLRLCRHCQAWFYACSERQFFCNHPEKRCQWKHYHTPQWRKKNRERNRVLQRDYRARNSGRKALIPGAHSKVVA
jgi:hypothetical protein